MTKPILTITPLKAVAPEASKAELMMLVTIACSPKEMVANEARPRFNLHLALDRSGSMRGKPLEEGKACCKMVVNRLSVGDIFSLTTYDNRTVTQVPAVQITEEAKPSIMRAIDAITVGGNTDLHAGWLAAAGQAAPGLAPGVLTRVLVLSDGNITSGLGDVDEIAKQAAALAEKGITTSTIGLGSHFNEHLMTQLALAGQGQSNYGETADELMPTFEAEMGLLSATAGKNVKLRLSSTAGRKVHVQNGYRVVSDGVWHLPNLVHGAEVTTLVRVAVEDLSGLDASLLDVEVSYDDVEGVPAEKLAASLSQPLASFADFVTGASHPVVADRVREIEAADLHEQAMHAVTRHDFPAVLDLATKIEAMADGNPWLMGQAATMRELAQQRNGALLSKEATYASSKLRSSYTTSAPLADGTAEPEFLKRRVRQGRSD